MASYTMAAGERGVYAKTLVAATVDTVTFNQDVSQIEVTNFGTGKIYFTADGSTPTVAGGATFEVPENSARTVPAPGQAVSVVKLISSGTPTYSVSGS